MLGFFTSLFVSRPHKTLDVYIPKQKEKIKESIQETNKKIENLVNDFVVQTQLTYNGVKTRALDLKKQQAKGVKKTCSKIKNTIKQVPNFSSKDTKKTENDRDYRLYKVYLKKIRAGICPREKIEIARVVDYCLIQANTKKLGSKTKKEFRMIFEAFGKLGQEYFHAPYFFENQTKLERILSPKYHQLMKAQEKNKALQTDKDHQLLISLERALLAAKLGVADKAAGGCNGAVFKRGPDGKFVAVFKPTPERSVFNVKEKGKETIGQFRLLNRVDRTNESYAEVAAFHFSKDFGFNMAPAAKMVEIDGRKGAFLEFLGGYQELKEVRQDLDKRTSFTKEELFKWQLFIVSYFLSLNFDGHDENIFIKRNKNGEIIEVAEIDHGNSGAEFQPGEWGLIGNRKAPAKLKISNIEFLPEITEFVNSHLTEKNYAKFVNTVTQEQPNYWSPRMDMLHRNTFDVLINGLNNKTIRTPVELLDIITAKQYEAYLNYQEDSLNQPLTNSVIMEVGQEEADMFKSFVFMNDD